jgi:hypothetical protein
MIYLDKLDGIICNEEYVRLSKKFRSELADVKFRIEGLAEGKKGLHRQRQAHTLTRAKGRHSLLCTDYSRKAEVA